MVDFAEATRKLRAQKAAAAVQEAENKEVDHHFDITASRLRHISPDESISSNDELVTAGLSMRRLLKIALGRIGVLEQKIYNTGKRLDDVGRRVDDLEFPDDD